MNKFFRLFLCAVMSVILLCLSVAPCFAAVNGKDAAVGSTVEYAISISDSEQNITGIHMEIFFDQSKLRIKEVNTDNLVGSTTVNDNQNADGTIKIVNGLINGENGLECKEKTELARVTFEVIAEGDSEIRYYIPYLYDYEMVNLYKYTLSQTLTVDGEVLIENVPPVLAGEDDFSKVESFDKGDFDNSPQGTGSGIKVLPTEYASDVLADSAEESLENKLSTTTLLIIICAVVIVIAIAVVVLVVLKAKSNKA